MKILKLKLRGAIGIRKGLGLEEVEIDFSQFNPGLIALTGRNGSGKTTIMENLHPYRCMVSRDGSLQSHFYLKDSYRWLMFEMNGIAYSSRILIDALTGASEAYLSSCEMDGSNPINLNDGKLTTYDVELEKVLGSQDLFFNSVFSGQKSKGIAELKPAERRKLFYELLNLNVYDTYLESAKAKLKVQELKLAEIEGELKAIGQSDVDLNELDSNRLETETLISNCTFEIDGLERSIEILREGIKQIEIEVNNCNQKMLANSEIRKQLGLREIEIKKLTEDHILKINRLNLEIYDYNKLIERSNKIVASKDKIETKLKRKGLVLENLTDQQKQKGFWQSEVNRIGAIYANDLKNISDREKELSNLRINCKSSDLQFNNQQRELIRIRKEVKIIDEVPCTQEIGSSCQFLLNAYDSKNRYDDLLQENEKTLTLYTIQKNDLEKAQYEFDKDKNLVETCYKENHSKFAGKVNQVDLTIQDCEIELKEIEKGNWEKLQVEANEADNNINLYNEKIRGNNGLLESLKKNFQENIDRIQSEIKELNSNLDNTIDEKLTKLTLNLTSYNSDLAGHNKNLASKKDELNKLKYDLQSIELEIEQFKKNQARILQLNEDRTKVENEIRDWTFLSKAFDKTGIPVLKLENSGIEITTIANELLAMFENKFRIVFETTSLTKDKKKLKETFDINIVEEDGVCEIGNKSGGQQVWLETAIQLAISLVVRQQGRNIQTSFLDEKDSALDLENAYSYIEMIKKAHALSGVHNTFIITHRPELLDFIPQQIVLQNGLLNIITN